LMGNSQDGGNIATVSGGLKTYVRKSPSDGIAVFLDNQGTASVQTQVKLSSPAVQFPAGNTQITVASNEIRPVVVSAPWTTNASFAYLATSVLGKLTLGSKTYYVCYGRSGESGEIAVQYTTAPATAPATPWTWDTSTKLARATFTYPTGDAITELPLDSGDGSSATFLVINSPLADRTWFTDKSLFVGATYVDEDLNVQLPAAGGKVVVYSSTGRADVSQPAVAMPTVPALGTWQWRDAAAEAAASYDDSAWASSAQPQPFGAYNFQNGYGWYRAKFTATAAGSVTANIGGGVRASAMAFANGTKVTISNNSFTFNAVAGTNTVALLAKHEGLDKLYNVTGSTGTTEYAGVWGNVTNGGSALASAWKFRGGLGAMDETAVVGLVKNWSTFVAGTWSDTQTTKSWPAFWRGSFKSPLQSGVFATVGLRTSGLSSGSAWVNGHNIGRFSGNTLLYVPESWLTADNTVVIYDASGNSPTGAKLEYIETRARYASATGAGGTSGTGGTTGASSTGGTPGSGGKGSTGGSLAQGGATGGSSTGSNVGGAHATGGALAVGGTSNGTVGGSFGPGGAPTTIAGGTNAVGGKSATSVNETGGSIQVNGGNGGASAIPSATGGSAQDAGSTLNTDAGNPTNDSGCSCATAGHSGSRGTWLALGIAVLSLRRRRPRPST